MVHRRLLTVLAIGAVLAGASAIGGAAAPTQKPLTSQQKAQKLLSIKGLQMSAQVRQVLEMQARGDRQLATDQSAGQPQPAAQSGQSSGGNQESRQGMANVLVNNPGEDTHQTGQTTQSETAIGVSGRNVVVGFNDSQTALLFMTAGANLQGYAYSRDGGRTFTDAGALPNRPGEVNLGDPWLGTDRSGNFYFSNLITSIDPVRFGYTDIGVSKSTDGGRTFGTPVRVDTQPEAAGSYSSDKDALATGRDPAAASHDNVYVGWDDFLFDPQAFLPISGLPVSHSYDGGATWQVVYADKMPIPLAGCGFQQYIGAYPIVDPHSGVVYLGALRLHQDNPNCDFNPAPPLTSSQVVFKSVNAGQSWTGPVVVSNVVTAGPMNCFGNPCFQLGSHQYMRDLEFPSLAIDSAGNVYDSWNDGRSLKSHILISRSTDGGLTWGSANPVTTGANDEMQPALSADRSGLHVLYYMRNADNTLDVVTATSTDGGLTWSSKRVTSQSFPGVFTVPQFDPIIAFAYMGDYIANVSDGSSQYFAWGDNRNSVTDFLFPQGRHDPDVFFAKHASDNNGGGGD